MIQSLLLITLTMRMIHRIKEYNLSLVVATDITIIFQSIKLIFAIVMQLKHYAQLNSLMLFVILQRVQGYRASINDPYEYFRSNNNGTMVIFEVARKCGIKHVVCCIK